MSLCGEYQKIFPDTWLVFTEWNEVNTTQVEGNIFWYSPQRLIVTILSYDAQY